MFGHESRSRCFPLQKLTCERGTLPCNGLGNLLQGTSDRSDHDAAHDRGRSAIEEENRAEGAGGECNHILVKIIRAEGIPASKSKSIFRVSKKSTTQRRYVRVSLLSTAQEKEALLSSDTLNMPSSGTECRWGESESAGDVVFSLDNRSVLCHPVKVEASLTEVCEPKFLLEVEIWTGDSQNRESDVLLGRGRMDIPPNNETPEGKYLRCQWVMLYSEKKPRGKIEISLSISSAPRRVDKCAVLPEQEDLAGALTQGRQGTVRTNEDDRVADHGHVGELITRSKCDTEKESCAEDISISHMKKGQDPVNGSSVKSRSPKWGLPRMPKIQGSLTSTMSRTTKMGVKEREMPLTPKSIDRITADVDLSQTEDTDRLHHRATSEENVSGNGKGDDKERLRGVQQSVLSLKESLQATWMRIGSGVRAERGGEVDVKAGDTGIHNEAEQSESVQGRQRVNSGSSSSSHHAHLQTLHEDNDSSSDPSKLKSSVVSEVSEQDVRGQAAGSEPGLVGSDSDGPEEHPQNNTMGFYQRKAVTQVSIQEGFLNTGYQHPEGRSSGRQSSKSPLRSLLQEAVIAHDVSTSNRDEVDESDESSKGSNGPEGYVVDGNINDAARAEPLVTLNLAGSMKSAAMKLKTTLTSPTFPASLKGMGWSRQKEEEGRVCASPTNASKGNAKGGFRSTCSNAPELLEMRTVAVATVFRAIDLPRILAETNFGRVQKDGTLSPYIRLHLCGMMEATSVAQGGECEWHWGTESKGEAMKISIPETALPDAGINASKLVVEAWNKMSEERDEDIMLGSTEIPLIDLLGRKTAWADLKLKRSQAGRVELSIMVDEEDPTSREAQRDSGRVCASGPASKPAQSGTVCGAAPSTDDAKVTCGIAHVQRNPKLLHAQEVDGFALTQESDPDEGLCGTLCMPSRVQHHAAIDDRANVDNETHEHSLNNLARKDVDLFSFKSLHGEAPDENESTLSDSCRSLVEVAEQHSGVDRSALATSEKNSKHGAGLVAPPEEGIQAVVDHDGENTNSTKSHATTERVEIAVAIYSAEGLRIVRSDNVFGQPREKATQSVYMVLNVCETTQATPVMFQCGQTFNWPDTAVESVDLAVSFADLTAEGWGKTGVGGAHMTLDVWTQADESQGGDALIGSAKIRLEDHVGRGDQWVDVRQQNENHGRVKLDIKCPMLQEKLFGTSRGADQPLKLEIGETTLPKQTKAGTDDGPGCPGSSHAGKTKQRVKHHVDDARGDRKRDGLKRQRESSTRDSSVDKFGKGSLSNSPTKSEDVRPDVHVKIAACDVAKDSLLPSTEPVGDEGRSLLSTDDTQEIVGSVEDERNGDSVTEDVPRVTGTRDSDIPPACATDTAVVRTVLDGLPERPPEGLATPTDKATIFSPSQDRTVINCDNSPFPHGSSEQLSESQSKSDVPLETGSFVDDKSKSESTARGSQPTGSREGGSRPCDNIERRNGEGVVEGIGQDPEEMVGDAPKTSEQSHSQDEDRPPRQRHAVRDEPKIFNQKAVSWTLERQRVERLERACLIARRRRNSMSAPATIERLRLTCTDCGSKFARKIEPAPAEQSQAAAIIQGGFRGSITRRNLRLRQRAAVKVQATYRGHWEKLQCRGLHARAKRARVEEKRTEKRRFRMTSAKQVRVPKKRW